MGALRSLSCVLWATRTADRAIPARPGRRPTNASTRSQPNQYGTGALCRHQGEKQFDTTVRIWHGYHVCTSVPDSSYRAELVVFDSRTRVAFGRQSFAPV